MKELTALDINYLVKELKALETAKVDQIYQPSDLLIRFHSTQLGKVILRINKKFIFLTEFKESQINPSGFCMALRKKLKNSRLKSFEQVDFERVVKLVFETKEGVLNLYIELFSKSNLVLTNKDNLILASLSSENTKRIIKKGEEYILPKKEHNFLTLKENELVNILANSDLSLVKTLATKLSLGGVYAEYVLQDYNKDLVANKFKETKELFKKLVKLKNQPICPSKIKSHLVPFKTDVQLESKTYNEALEKSLTSQLKEEHANISLQPFLKKKERLEKIIQTQQKTITELNDGAVLNTKKGELIYNNYQLIEQIIAQLKLAKKSMSWGEIKAKVKQKTLKRIDEGQGKIVLNLK
ncbi:hypothetical protein HN592_00690 [Candidatus Woesearchaeota archaeon]|jgi:predicted ribosome quality control (RQC) complex YloA/Tae2 family protein|nr:hypothetical protein [Candidatus Woesearchaeota archaeon]MBT4368821.1 hypothetical protein [Candidatus Woesearchaeota archaeon]MBT4712110.1 hypothetical protein [Candidatus Woesearchaeota archaeon]MBT6639142.1 hypothetical protein [Candidatus Woesearchaeota archaeon]MBT7134342.1 hypothetical protein [Candidatus Woesearchaeota archaeon]